MRHKVPSASQSDNQIRGSAMSRLGNSRGDLSAKESRDRNANMDMLSAQKCETAIMAVR